MLTNFFGNSKPINSLVLTALFLVLFSLALFSEKIDFIWSVIPWFLLVFGVVNFINSKNNLTFDNSYMFLFFVLLLGFFPQAITINTTFYASLTVLLFLRKVYSLQSSKRVFQKLFDAGFWLGISFLIEPFTVVFALLLYGAIYLHQRFTIQTLSIPVLGFFAPVFLYFTYCFWYDKINGFQQLFNWFTDYDFSLYEHVNYLFSLFFVGFFLLISIALKTPKALAVKNTFRKNWVLILLHFSLALLLVLLIKNKNGTEFLFVLFPSALILANGIELYQKKMISDIIIVALFVGAIILSFV